MSKSVQEQIDRHNAALNPMLIGFRERALREGTQSGPRADMLCKCGSVLSAVTFTCVRGEYCPERGK